MNTDFLDLFLRQLSLSGSEQQSLKAQISLYALERAVLELGDQLSADDQSVVSSFLGDPSPENQGRLQKAFATPDRQSILASAFLGVLQGLVDDPAVVAPEKRDAALGEMQQYLESQQALG